MKVFPDRGCGGELISHLFKWPDCNCWETTTAKLQLVLLTRGMIDGMSFFTITAGTTWDRYLDFLYLYKSVIIYLVCTKELKELSYYLGNVCYRLICIKILNTLLHNMLDIYHFLVHCLHRAKSTLFVPDTHCFDYNNITEPVSFFPEKAVLM